ncbi:helix-turn-helix transcriptional regulator [Vibrio sinaloensis]|uniref:helix-turn-helix transcriptional regulator n=1 Tax=Photobacterium sp. (strain ATCC 43367) TaxID=379097 RepID=UPI00206B5046|nr:AlpA family transcriptional regulator [Vibrio sinaloensis]UPQ87068.1 AlpA family transcriptional regulator [Vibrio sinaloensis]
MTDGKVLRLNELTELLGVSKSTIYKWINEGHFPSGVLLGPNTRGWLKSEVLSWIESAYKNKS